MWVCEGRGGGFKVNLFSFSILVSKRKSEKKIWVIFLGEISLRRVVIPSPKIVVNLSRTGKKLHCKGEPYRISGYPSFAIDVIKRELLNLLQPNWFSFNAIFLSYLDFISGKRDNIS